MEKKLYVGNINLSTTEDTIRKMFSNFGKIVSIKIIKRDKYQFGFIEMNNSSEAKKVMTVLNGHECDGNVLKVDEARPSKEKLPKKKKKRNKKVKNPIITEPDPNDPEIRLSLLRAKQLVGEFDPVLYESTRQEVIAALPQKTRDLWLRLERDYECEVCELYYELYCKNKAYAFKIRTPYGTFMDEDTEKGLIEFMNDLKENGYDDEENYESDKWLDDDNEDNKQLENKNKNKLMN